jgi:hypothetical protein
VGVGAALVLFSKEEVEVKHRGAPKAPAVAVKSTPPLSTETAP